MIKEEFSKVYELLIHNYTNIEIDPLTPKLHYQFFKEIPIDKFKKAVIRIIGEEEFFPKTATINKYLREISGIPTLAEVRSHIYKIIDTYHKGGWSSKDYPDIVCRIIKDCGHISSIMQLSNDDFISITKRKYTDIAEEIKKEDNNGKQLR